MRLRRLCVGTVLLLLAGCADKNGAQPGATASDVNAFSPQAAAAVLTAFDQADSAASSAGNIDVLKSQEVSPALDASVAGILRAQAQNRTQPPFSHVDPGFAIPAGDPQCFLLVATLKLAGEELARTDLSQFVRQPAGGWKLSHNVLVAQDGIPMARSIAGRPSIAGDEALDPSRRQALERQIFARTTGAGTPDLTVVLSSNVLDKQLAAGWAIYQQQMGTAGIGVDRTLDGADWSACAVAGPSGTLAFLTLRLTDTIAPRPNGPPVATLVPQSPDMMATGHRTPVQGRTVTVTRVEVFALFVPPQGGATVLGVSDAATSVDATN